MFFLICQNSPFTFTLVYREARRMECSVVRNVVNESVVSENIIVGISVTVVLGILAIGLALIIYLFCLTTRRTVGEEVSVQ